MYIPKHFEESNPDILYEFIRLHPLATLVANTHMGHNAEHIPVMVKIGSQGERQLQGHIALANPLWKSIENLEDVLLIFQADNSYISPNWFPSKKVDGRVVPTWNYRAVHMRGSIRFIHDSSWKMDFLDHLTRVHEHDQETPWFVSDAPAEFIEKLLPAIVGFEITVREIFGKFKLSQNQSLENRAGVARGLEELHTRCQRQYLKIDAIDSVSE